MITNTNYKKLMKLVSNLEAIEEAATLKADGFMDLHVDMLYQEKDHIIIALSHYYKHLSGDMIADPDMRIRVIPAMQSVEALSYQDSFGYREVYPSEGMVNVKAKKELNCFLNTWLSNLLNQGHTQGV